MISRDLEQRRFWIKCYVSTPIPFKFTSTRSQQERGSRPFLFWRDRLLSFLSTVRGKSLDNDGLCSTFTGSDSIAGPLIQSEIVWPVESASLRRLLDRRVLVKTNACRLHNERDPAAMSGPALIADRN